ncbi:hypothetical protein M2436_007203 [Streptomyces sp. HB372]|nr:hypothetical protein [Streptomyces sp. HB372]
MPVHDGPGGPSQAAGVERSGDLQLQLDDVGIGPGLLGQRVVGETVLEGCQGQYAVECGDRRIRAR